MGDRDALLTEDKTREVMSLYEERLVSVMSRAILRWQDLPPGVGAVLSPRSRASMIHDLIVDEANAEFRAEDHVKVSNKRGTVVLLFAGKVAVRFKKVTGNRLRYSISPTRRQRGIHTQQLALDGTDVRVTWATAGYRLDAAGGLQQTALVVNQGDSRRFAFDLDAAPAGVVQPYPVPEDDDEGLVIRPAASAHGRERGTGTP
jgi:hypothetical protein